MFDTKQIILGVVRHAITVAGGALSAKGLASASDVELLAGAVAVIVGVIWSVIAKKK